MSGVVTTYHLFTQAHRIIRLFGIRLYLRCLVALARGRRVTFLHMLDERRMRERAAPEDRCP
jgi:hypothetical protein